MDKSANFHRADFDHADLEGANFHASDLSLATFEGANLRGVILTDALVQETSFRAADLSGAIIDGLKGQPDSRGLATAIGLGYLKASKDLAGILDWRNLLKSKGFFSQAKQVNAAVWRNSKPSVFSYWLLDKTSGYGSDTWRPLLLLLYQWPLFALAYYWAVFQAAPGKRNAVRDDVGLYHVTTVLNGKKEKRNSTRLRTGEGHISQWKAIYSALAQSAVASFSVGFREFNLAPFLRKFLLPWNVQHETRGWVSRIEAVQSATGAFLLALAILSFLATPFEL